MSLWPDVEPDERDPRPDDRDEDPDDDYEDDVERMADTRRP